MELWEIGIVDVAKLCRFFFFFNSIINCSLCLDISVVAMRNQGSFIGKLMKQFSASLTHTCLYYYGLTCYM